MKGLSPLQDVVINCPKCQHEIRLDETLAGPLLAETRAGFEARIAEMQTAIEVREGAANQKMIEAETVRAATEDELARRIDVERARIVEDETKKAGDAARAVVDRLQKRADEQEAKLAEAQKAQADYLRKEQELADRTRELDLTVQKRINEETMAIRSRAQAEAAEAQGLKLAERDKTIEDMKRQIDDMKRKAEQGSQQLQGEVLELSLESTLQSRFPHDRIEPVAKGVGGADIIQHVLTPAGAACGAIIWEVKRTRNWQPGWLPKLRDDQRAAGAAAAILLSEALPPGLASFDLIDGIWVAHPRLAEPMALILRQSLLDLRASRIAQDGQASKTEMVYAYLTGPRFRHRVEVIIERFTEMQDDLRREMRATQKLWAKREQQIGAVIGATAGLYGDLQGIAGSAVTDLPGLDMPLLPADEAD